mmetsp:Transcript_27182/g.57379  ORF Transcript_27182/g.57379 Transcript_27182/m.57379 type:complete len:83 (-) Transcript_27182:1161-1409(-)
MSARASLVSKEGIFLEVTEGKELLRLNCMRALPAIVEWATKPPNQPRCQLEHAGGSTDANRSRQEPPPPRRRVYFSSSVAAW